MRTKLIALLLFALPFVAFAQTTPEGRWKTLDDETGKPMTIAEVYKAADGTLSIREVLPTRFTQLETAI